MAGINSVLQRYINADGPLDLARYMEICLTHPDFGYYVTRDPLGKDGDFVTAPEVSQMFGEMIGVWAAILWNNIGMPASLTVVELGPGRGTLMADLIRGSRHIPGFHDALNICFVEKSPVLRQKQKQALEGVGFANKVSWADDISDLKNKDVTVVIGNEFIDALPIRQLEFTDKGWMERRVSHNAIDGFFLGLSPADTHHTDMMPKHPEVGDIYEFSPARDAYVKRIIDVMNRNGGAALLIDYGHDQVNAKGDTFQAMQDHQYVDPFEKPGSADLTSHVDFHRIGEVADKEHCYVYGSVTQGDFLHKLGIGKRAEMLCHKNPKKAEEIYKAYQRLTADDEMGKLFKVMSITRRLNGEPLL